MEDMERMKAFKWALAGAGGLVVAGLLAVTALGSGISQAEEPGGFPMRELDVWLGDARLI